MSTGQTLNRLEAVLGRLETRIRQAGLDLQGKNAAPKVSDTSYPDFWKKLAGFSADLRLVARDLRSVEGLLGARDQRAWKLPRAAGPGGSLRVRERQGIESHRQHLARVYRRAARVEAALRQTYFDGMTPTNADLVKAFEKLVRDGQDFLGKYDTQALTQALQQDGDALSLPIQPAPGGAPLSFVVALIAMYVLGRKRE